MAQFSTRPASESLIPSLFCAVNVSKWLLEGEAWLTAVQYSELEVGERMLFAAYAAYAPTAICTHTKTSCVLCKHSAENLSVCCRNHRVWMSTSPIPPREDMPAGLGLPKLVRMKKCPNLKKAIQNEIKCVKIIFGDNVFK